MLGIEVAKFIYYIYSWISNARCSPRRRDTYMSHLTLRLISETICRNRNNEGTVQPNKPCWEWLVDGHEFVWSKHFSQLLMGWTVQTSSDVCLWWPVAIVGTSHALRGVAELSNSFKFPCVKDLSSSVMLESYTLPTLAKTYFTQSKTHGQLI